jgi:hypothetical protein
MDYTGPDARLDSSTVHTAEGNSDSNFIISEYITVYILHKKDNFPRFSSCRSILRNRNFHPLEFLF